MKVLCGMRTSDVSLLQGLIRSGVGDAPNFETLQALFDPTKQPRRSTFEKYTVKETGQDIGLIHDFITSDSFKAALTDWDGRYRYLFELYVEIIQNPQKFNGTPEGTICYKFQLEGFPQLWSCALHIEGVIYDGIKEHHLHDFPTKLPHQEFRKQLRQWPNEKKALVFELHVFVLYMAAIEIDLSEWDAIFTLIPPSAFVPSSAKGRVLYPMNAFWKWLRHECDCSTWKQLAELLQSSEQLIKKHANTKTLKGTPSWSEFWRMMNNAQPVNDRSTPFMFKTSLAYGIARIMQEHTHRCVDLLIEHFCEIGEIENYYLRAIREYKQNECRRIPLHPSFSRS